MNTAEPDTNESSSNGNFFTVALNKIDSIVRLGGNAPEVMTYLILVRGAGNRSYSQWGANSCSKYTELTYNKAEQSLQWLQDHGFIRSLTDKKSLRTRPKWHIEKSPDDIEVALANALIGGVGKGKQHPPMKRIDELRIGTNGGLNETRLDVLMVLLHLYQHQILADYGGINPRCGLYREWEAAQNSWGEVVQPIAGTSAALYEIQGSHNTIFFEFAKGCLFYVDDDEERTERFWEAFNNLKHLGWLYETTQIWTNDPTKDPRAEPLYTLYVHDRHMRKQDPYLATEIHNAAFRAEAMDRYSEFSEHLVDDNSIIRSNKFRYIANIKKGGYPIGIYRLKFRPHTKDTGKGMAAESRRIRAWAEALKATI